MWPRPGIFSPALDPRALPRSIGISFTVEAASNDPDIEICATWARYRPDNNHDWQREPACYLTGVVNAARMASPATLNRISACWYAPGRLRRWRGECLSWSIELTVADDQRP